MSNIIKSIVWAFLVLISVSDYATSQQNIIVVNRNDVKVYDNSSNSDATESSDNENNVEEKDLNIKYDMSDLKKESFRDDVERNCIVENKTITTTSYKCSDAQKVEITKTPLLSKNYTVIYEGPQFPKDVYNEDSALEINYSYITYISLVIFLLLFLIPIRRKKDVI